MVMGCGLLADGQTRLTLVNHLGIRRDCATNFISGRSLAVLTEGRDLCLFVD